MARCWEKLALSVVVMAQDDISLWREREVILNWLGFDLSIWLLHFLPLTAYPVAAGHCLGYFVELSCLKLSCPHNFISTFHRTSGL